jgi:hypothetical protein
MTLKEGHWPLLGTLVVIALLLGCHKPDQPQPSGPAADADAKSQIYHFLARQTGQKNFKPGVDLELPAQVATLRSNANVLEQRTLTLRASLRASDEEQTPLQKEIEVLRTQVTNLKREAGEARTRLQEAEQRDPRDATEVATRQKERAAAEAAWKAKREELAGKQASLEAERATRQQARVSVQRELQEAERAWELARVEAGRKQTELSNQEDVYIRAVREQMAVVPSYPALYQLVGEQLTTADRLLAEPDVARRRMGLKMAREACSHVNSGGVNVWLAARIVEAYFWPNLELADAKSGSRERALELLETCRRVLFDTDETNNVLRNYELLLTNAPNARAADTFRVQLADWLEEKGSLDHVAKILDEIRDAEVLASAAERITRVKQRVASIQ